MFFHYSGNTPFGDDLSIRQQVLVNKLGAIALFTDSEKGFDLW